MNIRKDMIKILIFTLALILFTSAMTGQNQPPIANAGDDISVGDTQDYGIVYVKLYGQYSTDPDGTIVKWTWTEGGKVLDIRSSGYGKTWLTVGVHNITLTVTDNDGLTDTDDFVVFVYAYDELPVPVPGNYSAWYDSDGSGDETITVDGSASWDRGGSTITSYRWLLNNDPNKVLATGATASFSLGIGTWPVYLEVTNSSGVVMSEKTYLTVNPNPSNFKVYYVQDTAYNANASDSNAGTDINHPWATWQKAFDTAMAGDTVYFRGGTWRPTNGLTINPNDGLGHSGTYKNHIVFINYQDEKPVRNCINYTSTSSIAGVNIMHQTYVEYTGLTITQLNQHVEDQWLNGWGFTYCGNIWLRELTTCYTMGAGFRVSDYDTLYMYNCDSYENADTFTTGGDAKLGGHADGYTISSKGLASDTFKVTHIENCRAWRNSDDGFDIGASKQIYMIGDWSWGNGRYDGDGNGFKYSFSCVPRTQRITRNCIAAYNKSGDRTYGGGYAVVNLYDDIFSARMTYLNCVSYQDYGGWRSADSYCDCNTYPDAADDYIANCVVYNPQDYSASFNVCDYTTGDPSYVKIDSSTFVLYGDQGNTKNNTSYVVTNDDFLSLDTAELSRPRKADGSLPDINFMKLAPGSDLIDRGIDAGLPYNGAAPDLGWYEYDGNENIPPNIKIITPATGSSFKEKDTIQIKVEASDIDGKVTKVEFYSNNTKIGESDSEPWSFSWGTAPVGSLSLKATATDDKNTKATSGTININVEEVRKLEITNYSPNPTSDIVTIVYYSPRTTSVNISVSNSTGTKINSSIDNAKEGENNRVDINLSGLASGVYTINLNDGSSSDACSVTKQDTPPVRELEIINSTSTTYDNFTVYFYSPKNTNITIEVFNSSGNRVMNTTYSTIAGNNETELNLSGLADGEYRVTLYDGNTSVSCYVTKLTREEPVIYELIEASPDPTVDLFAIKFNNPSAGTVLAEVFDDAGRKVMEDDFNVVKGLNKIVLNLSSLIPGQYKITVDNGKDTKLEVTVTRQAYYNN